MSVDLEKEKAYLSKSLDFSFATLPAPQTLQEE